MTAVATPARTTDLLRFALRLDGAVSGTVGVAYLAASGPLADLLGVPSAWLLGVGAFMAAYGALVWLVSLAPRRPVVLAVVVGNLGWALASLILAALDWHSPTATGTAWIVLQGLITAGFAALQAAGLRRA